VLDATVRAVTSCEFSLILDRRLAEGIAVTLLNRRAPAGAHCLLLARVAHAARLGARGWLVRYRFDIPLSEGELEALLN
jgi:hypothetical protein